MSVCVCVLCSHGAHQCVCVYLETEKSRRFPTASFDLTTCFKKRLAEDGHYNSTLTVSPLHFTIQDLIRSGLRKKEGEIQCHVTKMVTFQMLILSIHKSKPPPTNSVFNLTEMTEWQKTTVGSKNLHTSGLFASVTRDSWFLLNLSFYR